GLHHGAARAHRVDHQGRHRYVRPESGPGPDGAIRRCRLPGALTPEGGDMQYAGPDGELGTMRCIRAELEEGILTMAFHRPRQRNLIDVALSGEMEALLQAVHHDEAVRVVVL